MGDHRLDQHGGYQIAIMDAGDVRGIGISRPLPEVDPVKDQSGF